MAVTVNHRVTVGADHGEVLETVDPTSVLRERFQVVDVRESPPELAVRLLEVESAADHLATKRAGYAQCLVELCLPQVALAAAMGDQTAQGLSRSS